MNSFDNERELIMLRGETTKKLCEMYAATKDEKIKIILISRLSEYKEMQFRLQTESFVKHYFYLNSLILKTLNTHEKKKKHKRAPFALRHFSYCNIGKRDLYVRVSNLTGKKKNKHSQSSKNCGVNHKKS